VKPRGPVARDACPAAIAALLATLLPALVPAPDAGAADRATRGSEPRLVILVRHAEKAAEPPDDPPLTAAGEKRARNLATVLADTGVSAIVTSEALRTRATAGPLAKDLDLTPVVVAVKGRALEEHVTAVAAEVRRHPGEVVLVVGHSNTIPAIVAALGGPRLRDIGDAEFGNLFVLVPDVAGGARLVRATYGAPDAS
jgi:broad specificity phosphatase PhoE